MLHGDSDSLDEREPFLAGIDKNQAPADRLISKATQGRIEESDAWGVSIKGQYLDRDIKVDNVDEADIWNRYQWNAWIRACVDKIIKEVVKYQIVVTARDSDKINDANVKKHIKDVEDLLADPNEKIESFDDIRRKYLRDILVYDAGSLEIVKKNGRPWEIYDVRGANIRLNLDKHGNFKNDEKAYKLVDPTNKNNVLAEFASDELIYMIANPVSGSAYGLSPVETLWDEIENDNEAAAFNKKLLKHGGLITGILSFANMPDSRVKRQRRFWEEELRRKGQQLVITNNPEVTFTRLSDKQQDMQFIEFQRWLLNKIMAVYGMQPLVLGVIDATTGKLNSLEQREQFKQDAVLPLLKLECHRLTDVLVKQGFEYDDVVITFKEPKNVDEEFDLEKVKTGCQFGIITIDEARAWINLPPLPDKQGEALVSATAIAYIQGLVEKDQANEKLAQVKAQIQTLLSEEL